MNDNYKPTRPVMNSKELAAHRIKTWNPYGGGDGYDAMETNRSAGFSPLAGWGRDGWDLGDWPYVVYSTRVKNGKYDLLEVVEGDHKLYSFNTLEDLHAAIDLIFICANFEYLGLTYDEFKTSLNSDTWGPVDVTYRGPYSSSRTKDVANV